MSPDDHALPTAIVSRVPHDSAMAHDFPILPGRVITCRSLQHNVLLQARAARGVSPCKPLLGFPGHDIRTHCPDEQPYTSNHRDAHGAHGH